MNYLEQSILITSIFKPELFSIAKGYLREDMFSTFHELWGILESLDKKGKPTSISNVEAESKRKYTYSKNLKVFAEFFKIDSFEQNCKDLRTSYIGSKYREMIIGELADMENQFCDESISRIIKKSGDFLTQSIDDKNLSFDEQIQNTVKEIEEASKSDKGLLGVPTGTELDNVFSGWLKSKMYVWGGRPGMGKTAFTLFLTLQAAKNGTPVVFYSYEMTHTGLIKRLLAIETGINSKSIREGNLTDSQWDNLHDATEKLSQLPIKVVDFPPSSNQLKASFIKHVSDGAKMFVYDFIQRIPSEEQNLRLRIGGCSRQLADMAKEYNVPVHVLSQLNRSVETRGGAKRPMLSDLKEASVIEEDAYGIGFVYRPEYYGIFEDEEGGSVRDLLEIIIAKHKDGEKKTVKLRIDLPTGRISDWESEDYFQIINSAKSDLPNESNMRHARRSDDLNDIPF